MRDLRISAKHYIGKIRLDIKLVFSFAHNDDKKTEIHSIEISKKETEAKFRYELMQRGQLGKLEWLSIDPNFKILKEILYIDSSKEMLQKQLVDGETVYERLQAIESFTNNGFCLVNFQTMTI